MIILKNAMGCKITYTIGIPALVRLHLKSPTFGGARFSIAKARNKRHYFCIFSQSKRHWY